jgi:hypothetical protein
LEHHTNQIHDFNLGFGPPVNNAGDSTFWTTAIPSGSVHQPSGDGFASMRVSNLGVEDYFNLANALADGPSVEATASFAVRWVGPVTRTVNVSDPATAFAGLFREDQARVSWSASEDGFAFLSDPASTSTTVFAELGHEHNGRFFATGPTPGGSQAALGPAARALAEAPAAAGPARPPRPAGATGTAPADNLPPPQPAAVPGRVAVGNALPQALDYVFAGLHGRTEPDALRADAPAWAV